MLTGEKVGFSLEEVVAAGADDFLTKPANFEELYLRVRSLLRIGGLVTSLQGSLTTIQEQQRALEEASLFRERLNGFLIHDFKTLLSSVLLQAEKMLRDHQEPVKAWQHVLDRSEQLRRMAFGWLDFLQSEEMGIHPRLEPILLDPWLRQCLAGFATWLEVRQIRGEIQVDEALQTVWVDPILLERVLCNLLDNSIRHSPSGSPLKIAARHLDRQFFQIHIIDLGPGIPVEKREWIFEIYHQANDTHLHPNGRDGRRMGLAFSRLAVEAHGGRIWAEEGPGGGTCFVLQLPLAAPI